jgi:hypothetical protein
MTRFVAIPGTWSLRPGISSGDWYHEDSPWTRMMRARGFERARDPFVWSGGLDGLIPWRKHATWQGAAAGLSYYMERLHGQRVVVVAHSHALQVVSFAAAYFGVEIDALISIGSPIRSDIPYDLARKHIRFWQHVHSDRSDRWQWLGGIGDGALGIVRACPHADVNHALPDVGHSRILHEPALFARIWPQLLDAIRKEESHA